MKHSTWITAALATAAVLASAALVSADQEAGKVKGEGKAKGKAHRECKKEEFEAFKAKWQEFNKQAQEKWRAHFEALRSQYSKEELKNKTPAEACTLFKQRLISRHDATAAFAETMLQERLAFISQLMTEAGFDAEQQNARLARLKEAYEAHKAEIEAEYQKALALLDQLAADPNLTWEKLREVWKSIHEGRKAKAQEWRERHKNRAGKCKADKTS